ncbi:MAG: secondary thiamine-phosphate synthase enzyme YjbQ [Candidatus Peregrinibacteria bacterium]|nr:secondary thiamine-phosphate synthase enzyme YjbQ [Candidatus Peregrinibacteria bacterium]
MYRYNFETSGKEGMINIDQPVQKAVEELGIEDGMVTVFCPHSTASVTINESDDPAVQKDILHRLNDLVPMNLEYGHGEGNADAHIKASLIGSSVQVPVVSGRLELGRWQAIYFCEFDGPRKREVWVS